MIPTDGFAQIEVRSAAELRDWLSAHHTQEASVWLVTWKKAPGAPCVSIPGVLDELIAFGWIDGLRRKLDDARTMQLISPRKQQAWALTYKNRAARLEAEGRMHPAGRVAIAAASRLDHAFGAGDDTAQLAFYPLAQGADVLEPCRQGLHRLTKAAHLQRDLAAAAFAVFSSEQEFQHVKEIAVMIGLLGRIACQCQHPADSCAGCRLCPI